MKSYQALFTETQDKTILCGVEKPVAILRAEYEAEVLAAVYPEGLKEALAPLSLQEQLDVTACLDAFECGVLLTARLEEDYPLLSPEDVKSHWSVYNSLDPDLVTSVLATEGGLLLGLCVQDKILWLGGEISYRTTAWSAGDNNGAGYKGEGYYEATKYLTMLYRPTLLFNDVVLSTSYDPKEENIHIPDGVKAIESSAFEGREALKELALPEGLEKIGYHAFKGCTGLKSLVLPASVKKVSAGAFEDCTALESVTVLGKTLLDSMAFQGCKSLKCVLLSEAGVELGGWAFSDCESLVEVKGTEHIKKLGEYTFCGCRSLAAISLPDSLYSVANSTFSGCTALERIELSGVSSIGTYAFFHCTALEEVVMGKSLWNISSSAFAECIALRRVTLPASLKEEFEKAAEEVDLSAITYTLLEE